MPPRSYLSHPSLAVKRRYDFPAFQEYLGNAGLRHVYEKVLLKKFTISCSIRHFFSTKKSHCIIYGLQRSGTNYLESLIRLNYPGVHFQNSLNRSHYRHKHWRLYADKTMIPTSQYFSETSVCDARRLWALYRNEGVDIDAVVVVVREPLHWYRSYQRWAEQCAWLAASYHYLQEWRAFYGAWHALAAEDPERILLIRYEDFLVSDDRPISNLARVLQVPRVGTTNELDRVPQSGRFDAKKRAANLGRLTLDDFPQCDRGAILANLDFSLCEAFGYAESSVLDESAADGVRRLG